jgi:hypothetical protein
MGLFSSSRPVPAGVIAASSADPIPIAQIDGDKRYDVYCALPGEDRLYENVRFVGVRAFKPITNFNAGLLLEIETSDGSRMLIQQWDIKLICEHGVQPVYKVIRDGRDW